MLFSLGLFHKREAKPAQWAVFDSVGKDADDLIDDFEALGGLAAIGSATKPHRSMVCSYRFPSQSTKLRAGHSATVPVSAGSPSRVCIVPLDRTARTIAFTAGSTQAPLLAAALPLPTNC